MRDKNLLQRSPVALLALGISLASGFVACSDDDGGGGTPAKDGGAGSVAHDGSNGSGGSSVKDATADVSSKDTGTGGTTTADVLVADAAQDDVASEAAPQGTGGATGAGGASGAGGAVDAAGTGGSSTPDAAGTGGAGTGGAGTGGAGTGGHIDAGVGGHVDGGPDATPSNTGGSNDAQADVAPEAAPLPPLEVCTFLDTVGNIDPPQPECATETTEACYMNRFLSWPDFVSNWWEADCRIEALISTDDTGNQFTDYLNDLGNWTYFFFGCPRNEAGTDLPSQFALVQKASWPWPLTTEDRRAFGDRFIEHAIHAISPAVFSDADLAKMRARMEYLENAYEHTRNPAPGYSNSICSDAGSDASGSDDGGSDATPE